MRGSRSTYRSTGRSSGSVDSSPLAVLVAAGISRAATTPVEAGRGDLLVIPVVVRWHNDGVRQPGPDMTYRQSR